MMAQPGRADTPGSLLDPLKDPLEEWKNDDLLMDEGHRLAFAANYPDLVPIFDWPELRDLFSVYDVSAVQAKKANRSVGLIAVAIGFTGLLFAAWTPLVDGITNGKTASILGMVTVFCGVVSVSIGLWHAFFSKKRRVWLFDRFKAERIRQFHFQLIVNNIGLASDAASNPGSASNWTIFRQKHLNIFKDHMVTNFDNQWLKLMEDMSEDDVWLESDWTHSKASSSTGTFSKPLLDMLRDKRLGIQKQYVAKKGPLFVNSPTFRASAVSWIANLMTLVLVMASVLLGLTYATKWFLPVTTPVILGVYGSLAAVVAVLRTLNEGLQWSADSDRYQWYKAAVNSLANRFEFGDGAQKISLLRDMEHLSYQELRRFIVSASKSKFSM